MKPIVSIKNIFKYIYEQYDTGYVEMYSNLIKDYWTCNSTVVGSLFTDEERQWPSLIRDLMGYYNSNDL